VDIALRRFSAAARSDTAACCSATNSY
jgi:hypothetical protein